jgi:DNA-binding NarL/FixJ family response regulator
MTEPELPLLPLPPDKWQDIAAGLKFSPTQKTVVELILQNRCDKQIEAALNMPHSTLRTHLDRAFRKAHVWNRQELVILLCALSHGMGPPQG